MLNGRWPFTAHGDLTHFILCILFDILYMQCITYIQPYLIRYITVLLSLSVKRWSYPYPIKKSRYSFFSTEWHSFEIPPVQIKSRLCICPKLGMYLCSPSTCKEAHPAGQNTCSTYYMFSTCFFF